MKRYRVLNDYINLWYGALSDAEIEKTQKEGITLSEIKTLATSWNKSINELLEQCTEI